MIKQILVPLSRFRVHYCAASGRPYSQIERLVLRAIADGTTSITGLKDIFQIHPRLLVEAVVTLIQTGWVALSSDRAGEFWVTQSGTDAIENGQGPKSQIVRRSTVRIVREDITGCIERAGVIHYATRQSVSDKYSTYDHIRPEILDNYLDEGLVQYLLPLEENEWLQEISGIELDSKGAFYLPVSVDTATGKCVGLPRKWERSVAPYLLSKTIDTSTSQAVPTIELQTFVTSRDDYQTFNTNSTNVKHLAGLEEHRQFVIDALQKANSAIFIASAFIDARNLVAIERHIIDAVTRGLKVSLLWGYSQTDVSPQRSAIDILKRIKYYVGKEDLTGQFHFNQEPSGSHAKFCVHDTEDGWNAAVGSHNWLASVPGNHDALAIRDVSVVIRDKRVVAALSRIFSALWKNTPGEELSVVPGHWQATASLLDQEAKQLEGSETEHNGNICTVRIVQDREHAAMVRELICNAQERLLIASHQVGWIASTRIASLTSKPKSIQIIYGRTTSALSEEEISNLDQKYQRVGGKVHRISGMHAKVMVSDSCLYVGSYNLLSTDPFGKTEFTRELGVVVNADELCQSVYDIFNTYTS